MHYYVVSNDLRSFSKAKNPDKGFITADLSKEDLAKSVAPKEEELDSLDNRVFHGVFASLEEAQDYIETEIESNDILNGVRILDAEGNAVSFIVGHEEGVWVPVQPPHPSMVQSFGIANWYPYPHPKTSAWIKEQLA